MHVPDGFLSPQLTIPAYAVAAPLWAFAARRRFGADAVESLPLMGALTALAFVVQTIMIPVPGGTSAHLAGCTLLALLHGPLVAFVCETLVLVVQALFFGAGGITVLAVNALAIGLAGPAVAWLIHRALARFAPRLASFAAAWAGMQVSTLAIALVLGAQHALAPSYFPMPFAPTAVAMLVPSLLVTGPLEGAYTVAAIALLRRTRLHELV